MTKFCANLPVTTQEPDGIGDAAAIGFGTVVAPAGAWPEVAYGKSFKFIFKASNCRNYEAKVLSCISDNNTNKSISMTAQDALFKSSAYQIGA